MLLALFVMTLIVTKLYTDGSFKMGQLPVTAMVAQLVECTLALHAGFEPRSQQNS